MNESGEAPVPHEKQITHEPAFESDIVTINFISSNPQGIDVNTKYSLSRREDIDAYPLTDPQRIDLKHGMWGEVAFILKRKGLYTDEMRKANKAKDFQQEWELVRAAVHENKIDLTEEMAYKLAIRNQELVGDTLSVDVKDVPYPSYEVGSNPQDSRESHELTAVAAVAGALVTKDNKLVVQMRSGNRIFDQVLGASAAGMFDRDKLQIGLEPDPITGKTPYIKGRPRPINTDTVKSKFLEEAFQEIAVNSDDVEGLRIVSTAVDHTYIHDEFLLFGRLNLTSHELEQRALSAPRSQRKDGDFHFDEKFVFIDATPDAIETLLTQVKNPLPPTHLAAYVVAGYTLMLDEGMDEDGYDRETNKLKAEAWKKKVEEGVSRNYAQINRLVKENALREQGITEQSNIDRLIDSVPGYNPKIPANKQGLPEMGQELIDHGLLKEQSL